MNKKLFSDEEKVLRDAIDMMRLAVKKTEHGIRLFELGVIEASNFRQEDTKFPHPLCERIEYLGCDSHLRVEEKLDQMGIIYIWQLCALQEYELRGIYNFGTKCFKAVSEALERNGLEIGCTSRYVSADLIFRFTVNENLLGE